MSELLMLKKVKVGGLVYDVTFPHTSSTDSALLGVHSIGECKIKVMKEHEGYVLKWCKIHEAFLHEIVHAISSIYCSCEDFKHSSITKFSNGLYQVLSDNLLNIQTFRDYPKTLKIGGFIYDIVKNHMFPDESYMPWCSVNSNRAIVYFPKSLYCGEDIHIDFKAFTLCVAIAYGVGGVYLEETDDEDFKNNLKQIGSGIYQVLKENNIEKIIRNGVKADSKRNVK